MAHAILKLLTTHSSFAKFVEPDLSALPLLQRMQLGEQLSLLPAIEADLHPKAGFSACGKLTQGNLHGNIFHDIGSCFLGIHLLQKLVVSS